MFTLTECHYKKKLQKKTTRKFYVLSLGLGRKKVFFLARLRGRSILGYRISFFRLGLCFLCLSCSFLGLGSFFGLWGGLGPLALTFIFGPISPLALITSLAGSFWSLRRGESSLSRQGLLWSIGSKGKGRRDGSCNFANIWMVVYAPRLPLCWVCRDSYNIKGFIPVVPAYLS